MAVCLLHVNIGNRPACSDLPRLNRIVVIDRTRSADFTELPITWLHKAGAIGGTALQNGGRAIPDPIDVEPGEAFIENRPFQRSEEHTSELQSRGHLVCRLLLQQKHTTD